jgi:hypothetical protein
MYAQHSSEGSILLLTLPHKVARIATIQVACNADLHDGPATRARVITGVLINAALGDGALSCVRGDANESNDFVLE